jgi:hypothetical protein
MAHSLELFVGTTKRKITHQPAIYAATGRVLWDKGIVRNAPIDPWGGGRAFPDPPTAPLE